MQTFEEIRQADVQAKPEVMAAQRQLLESRYDLTPRRDPEAKMSRGKPLPVGPTARLASGTDWTALARCPLRPSGSATSSRIRRCPPEAGGGRTGLSGDADCYVPPAAAL